MSEKKKLTLKDFMMSPEQIESYSEPSIMDEYIKQNDPEQWDKIVRARNLKFATESAMMGSLGGGSPLGKFGKIRKHISEVNNPLPHKIYNKAIGHMDPKSNWVEAGKVIAKPLEEQPIGTIKHYVPEAEDIGRVVAKDMEPTWVKNIKQLPKEEVESSALSNPTKIQQPLSLEQRVDNASEKEKALFQRLMELTGRKSSR